MKSYLPEGAIHVRNVKLWAHVGVLDQERLMGQLFDLDFTLWLDLEQAAKDDDLAATADYSIAIREIQELSLQCNCLTIEHFSDQILNRLEAIYGSLPMEVILRKCAPPVHGFTGVVELKRSRNRY